MAIITNDTMLDSGVARTAGEAWTCNGGKLIIRTDTRVHSDSPAGMTGSIGSVTISATLGGGLLFDATNVRWLQYTGGSGVVPPIGTIISQGGVSGYFLGIWPSVGSAPLESGSTLPLVGFIKFREVVGGSFGAGILTGLTAYSAGADVTGWIEVVMDQAATITIPRSGSGHVTRGDWFYLDPTTGVPDQIIATPTNGGGAGTYSPGVWIETGEGTDVFDYWPALNGSLSNGWSLTHLGGSVSGSDNRQQFVKALPAGELLIAETVIQSATYSSVSVSMSYTWAADVANIAIVGHGVSVGENVRLDFTSGGATGNSGVFTVTQVVSSGVFTVDLVGGGTSGVGTCVSRANITSTGHGLVVGQRADFTVSTGALASGEFLVTSVINANQYQVGCQLPAGSSGNATTSFTIGQTPPANCRVRIPNIIGRQCTTGARASNAAPHATIASRPEWATTGAGAIDHEFFYSDWYYNLSQPFSVRLNHVATFDTITISECATPLALSDGGTSMMAAAAIPAMTLTSNFAGGTIENWNGTRGGVPSASAHALTVSACIGQRLINCKFGNIQTPRLAGSAMLISQSNDVTMNGCNTLNGPVTITASNNVQVRAHDYCDRFAGDANLTGTNYVFVVTSRSSNVLIDGVTEGMRGTIANCQATAGLFNVTTSTNITMRNIGTYDNPVGSSSSALNQRAYLYVSGGNNSGIRLQRCYVNSVRTGLLLDTNTDKGVTYESLSASMLSSGMPYTLTIAGLNATVRGCSATRSATGVNASVYGTHTYDQFTSLGKTVSTYTWVSNTCNITASGHLLRVGDKIYVNFVSGAATASGYYVVRSVGSSSIFSIDMPGSGASGSAVYYKWLVTNIADALVTQGVINLPMNEDTVETNQYVTTTGTPQYTSLPGLALPKAGDSVSIETHYQVKGHTGFYNVPAVITGSPITARACTYVISGSTCTVTSATHGLAVGDTVFLDQSTGSIASGYYLVQTVTSTSVFTIQVVGGSGSGAAIIRSALLIEYQIDTGSGYSTMRNLSRMLFSGAIVSGSNIVTVYDTAGALVGDCVYGQGIGVDATIVSVDSSTQLTLSVPSTSSSTVALVELNSIPAENTGNKPFRLKVKLSATTPSSISTLTYLTIPTITSPTSRNVLYPLDTTAVSFTGIPVNTDVVVLEAGTSNILDQVDQLAGTTYSFVYEGTPTIDIGFIRAGYVPFYLRGLQLSLVNSSLPISLTVDRNFV